MRILERSPKVGPLLARLCDRAKSYPFVEDVKKEQGELSEIMLDLLNLELLPSESELVTDVLLELVRQAERELRQSLSERLAASEGIPLRMILHLANDEISVAEPVLRQSPVLQEMDLIYIIKSHQADHWRAIANRPDLKTEVINTLADTGDIKTAINLTENRAITLTEYAMDLFVPLAGQSEELARPLLTRQELPQKIVIRLYEAVGEEIKKSIERTFPEAAKIAMQLVDDIVWEVKQTAEEDYLPSQMVINAAVNMKKRDLLHAGAMLSSLKRGMIPSFIAQFAVYADLTSETVYEMIAQKTGQRLAVACKALDIKKADFISFYLMTHKVRHHYQQVIDHQHLSTAINTYDSVSKDDAVRLLGRREAIY